MHKRRSLLFMLTMLLLVGMVLSGCNSGEKKEPKGKLGKKKQLEIRNS